MSEEKLGSILRKAREVHNFTQEYLAERVGVSKQAIYRWESGKVGNPRPYARKKIIEALELPHDIFALLNGNIIEGTIIYTEENTVKKEVHKTITVLPEESETLEHRENTSVEIIEDKIKAEEQREEDEYIEIVISVPKVYQGKRVTQSLSVYGEIIQEKTTLVTVDGRPLPYYDYTDPFLGDKAREGKKKYEWGYIGGGPNALTRSILADYFGEASEYRELRSRLKWWEVDYWMGSQTWKYDDAFLMDFVIWFPEKEWKISSLAISAWLREQKGQGDSVQAEKLRDIDNGWTGWSERWNDYNNF